MWKEKLILDGIFMGLEKGFNIHILKAGSKNILKYFANKVEFKVPALKRKHLI